MKVLVIGSSNVDTTNYVDAFPLPGETINGLSKKVCPGGKGLNQAIALKRAGADVTFVTAVGTDSEAEIIKETIRKDSLDNYLFVKSTFTGSATILVNKFSQNFIVVNHGANYALNKEDLPQILPLIEKTDFVLLQAELPIDITERIIDIAYSLHKKCVFNPAPAYLLKKEVLEKMDYLIPNEKEVLTCSGCSDRNEAVSYLLSHGVKHLLITLGEEGSTLYSQDEQIHVDAYKTKAVDTVAAGDTFIGYFLASLANGESERNSMMIASKASSIGVTRLGAIDSIPFKDEVLL